MRHGGNKMILQGSTNADKLVIVFTLMLFQEMFSLLLFPHVPQRMSFKENVEAEKKLFTLSDLSSEKKSAVCCNY